MPFHISSENRRYTVIELGSDQIRILDGMRARAVRVSRRPHGRPPARRTRSGDHNVHRMGA